MNLLDDWTDEPQPEVEGPFPRKVHVVCRARRTPLVFRSPKEASQAWQLLLSQGAQPPYYVRELDVIGHDDEYVANDRPGTLYLLATRWSGDLYRRDNGYLAHPFPQLIARDSEWAERYCAEANQRCRTAREVDPFLAPLRAGAMVRQADDRERLRILFDYVQDLGLAAPPIGDSVYLDWSAWWRGPLLEPWQREAVWTFLERELPYSLIRVGLRA